MSHTLRCLVTIGLSLLALAAVGCQTTTRTVVSPTARGPSGPLETQVREIMLQGLTDPDPHIRANAIEVAVTTRALPFVPQILRLLRDPAVPVRFLATMAIGDLQYTAARDEIAALLEDPDENVKIAAAYSMMKLGGSDYFHIVRDAVTSNDQTVRANAALLLGKSGKQEALPFLYWTLRRDDSSDMVVLQAAESIARLGDRRIYPKLWTRLISTYADDRMIGISAMAALGTEEAKNAIITMLDDPVLEVRLAAAEHLGRLRDTAGESVVLEAFDEKHMTEGDAQSVERIKVLTSLAIGAIGTDPLTKHLPDLLRDSSKQVRLAAAKAVLLTTH